MALALTLPPVGVLVDPDEEEIVLDAARQRPDEPEFAAEEAAEYLRKQRARLRKPRA